MNPLLADGRDVPCDVTCRGCLKGFNNIGIVEGAPQFSARLCAHASGNTNFR
jgi:hypothetical protein